MKSNIVFGFENAAWPALVLDDMGKIRTVNGPAGAGFGTIVEGQPTLAESIWVIENPVTCQQYLLQLERVGGGAQALKFKGKGGRVHAFYTLASSALVEGRKVFVMQFFSPGQLGAGGPGTADEPGSGGGGLDAGVAHKQKLECALQLARSVASDFNNALTSILGHTSLLLSRVEPSHPWRSSLVEVQKSAERAAEIANDLAAFSRQEKDPDTQAAGNLNEVVRRAVEVFQAPGSAGVSWKAELEARLFGVFFDEAKMQQAIVKLLENALQSLAGSGGEVVVRTRNREISVPQRDGMALLQPGHYVCVEIADNGVGIAPDIMPRIFEPFFTTKQPPHRGLGLAWAYGIATNHGGSVAVDSKLACGTSVRLYLPAMERVVHDHDIRLEDLGGAETVLMVDDEDLLLTMGQTVLSAYGYRVLTASSGNQALEIFSSDPSGIDLVITDLVMPGMSGRELSEHLRRVNPFVRIMCSSGYVRASGGAEDAVYLQKPFTSQELLRRVKQALTHTPGAT